MVRSAPAADRKFVSYTMRDKRGCPPVLWQGEEEKVDAAWPSIAGREVRGVVEGGRPPGVEVRRGTGGRDGRAAVFQ